MRLRMACWNLDSVRSTKQQFVVSGYQKTHEGNRKDGQENECPLHHEHATVYGFWMSQSAWVEHSVDALMIACFSPTFEITTAVI
jgi:hypothetical protein